ncbi:hypothetical protein SAMN04489727_4603 [Amycolatopsis tolypomycina]|uniref:Uncharacterized protein n=1 Tax=Amycolatopsis tolypomycina TaxID=208445 RepID=A0A1H4UCT2_9PSEU|nr:hypothetical protein [Amycolatopsis tolypomycina]SEC66549.1 hypothetical protein SAMN04489727_4603 [Amycolatopsis tolypomycina]
MTASRKTGESGRHRRLGLVVVLSAVLGALLGRLLTTRPQGGALHPGAAASVTTADVPVTARGSGSQQRVRRGTSAGYGLLASLLLAVSGWQINLDHGLPAQIAAVAAVLVLVVALRGSAKRRGRWASGVLAGLAILAIALALVLIMSELPGSTADVNGLLAPLMLFIVLVGTVAWLVASRGRVVLAEVAALLLIASMLGFVSFASIPRFTAPVAAPELAGNAVVFAVDPIAELSVEFSYESWGPAGMWMSLRVRPVGDIERLVSRAWVILLLDGLRFKVEQQQAGNGILLTDAADGSQILSGALGQSDSTYAGFVTGSFEQSAASRSVVSLPAVHAASPRRLHQPSNVVQIVGHLLVSPRSLAISVDGGNLDPLVTVTQASPPLEVQNKLFWSAQNELVGITYSTFDQGAEDRSRNVLFVIAILLGAATACLVAAMQVLLRMNPPLRAPD